MPGLSIVIGKYILGLVVMLVFYVLFGNIFFLTGALFLKIVTLNRYSFDRLGKRKKKNISLIGIIIFILLIVSSVFYDIRHL